MGATLFWIMLIYVYIYIYTCAYIMFTFNFIIFEIMKFIIIKFMVTFYRLFNSFIGFFNIKNITKILLIFVIGFLSRILIVGLLNVDVFYDYTSLWSILYYINMSIFSVSLLEFFTPLPNIYIYRWYSGRCKKYCGINLW